jgi:hypothetical protein
MINASAETAPDRRTECRSSLYLTASLYRDGASHPVKIRNISATGALVEAQAAFAPGSLVQLVRGVHSVHGLVLWTETGKLGLKFSGNIDVSQWRKTVRNAEQQRVDDIVRLVKGGAVPLPVNVPPGDVPPDIDRPSADLRRASTLLGRLGDRLATDGIVVASYPAELQSLDIAIQMIEAVRLLLESREGLAMDNGKFASLRRSAN